MMLKRCWLLPYAMMGAATVVTCISTYSWHVPWHADKGGERDRERERSYPCLANKAKIGQRKRIHVAYIGHHWCS